MRGPLLCFVFTPKSNAIWIEIQWGRPFRDTPCPGSPLPPGLSPAPAASQPQTASLAPGLFAPTLTSAWDASTLRQAHSCPLDSSGPKTGLNPDTALGARAQPWEPRDSVVRTSASHPRRPRLRTGPHRAPCAPGSRSPGGRWASAGGRAPPMDRSHSVGPDAPPWLQSPQSPAAAGVTSLLPGSTTPLPSTASGSRRLLLGSGR